MNKHLEDTILRQRHEASQRIKVNHPELCEEYEKRCADCQFWTGIDSTKNNAHCLHDLAPVTSALLPCPYFNAL